MKILNKVFFTIDNPRPNSPLIPLRNGVKIPSSKSLSMFGATSGIAYETALKLLEQNNFVYLCTHTEEEKYLLKEKLANKS